MREITRSSSFQAFGRTFGAAVAMVLTLSLTGPGVAAPRAERSVATDLRVAELDAAALQVAESVAVPGVAVPGDVSADDETVVETTDGAQGRLQVTRLGVSENGGYAVHLEISGLPAHTDLAIDASPRGGGPSVVATGYTDGKGELSEVMRLPTSARGEWVFVLSNDELAANMASEAFLVDLGAGALAGAGASDADSDADEETVVLESEAETGASAPGPRLRVEPGGSP